MNKKIKEMDTSGQAGKNYKVDVDDISKVSSTLKSITEPGDSVQFVDESPTSIGDPIKDAFMAGLGAGNSSIEDTFVVINGKLTNSDIAEKEFALYKGVNESDDDLPEIPDEERMERGDEYDVPVYEDFDKIMEELKESKAPTVKLTENVRPRIKKNDLIKYIKNKK